MQQHYGSTTAIRKCSSNVYQPNGYQAVVLGMLAVSACFRCQHVSRCFFVLSGLKVSKATCTEFLPRHTKSILGTLMAQGYVSDILHPHGLPLLTQHPGTLIEQDNICPHMAQVSMYALLHALANHVPQSFPNLTCVASTQTQCHSVGS